MLMAFGLLAACGSGGDSQQGAAPDRTARTGTSGARAGTLTAKALEKAAVKGTDLDGYEVERSFTSVGSSHKATVPEECAPVMHAVGGGSGFTATARVGRFVHANKAGLPTRLTLSSHSVADALQVMDRLRTAAAKCGGFKDVTADLAYEGVKVQPDAGYGDESVSLRLTQLVTGAGYDDVVRVPYALVAVRQGATVAMFSTSSRGRKAAVVPDSVVSAQLKKLRAQVASG
ncbi:hypothetical protein AB0N07_05895 [Streptomyces sp. NPDC051172]|uniref:hypothetical protein n=1 Tax=Streptomyces sp. NPDC051172 TaxID=3155796 RepID=UPI0034406AD8